MILRITALFSVPSFKYQTNLNSSKNNFVVTTKIMFDPISGFHGIDK